MRELLLEENKSLYLKYFGVSSAKFFNRRIAHAILFVFLYSLLLFYLEKYIFLVGIPLVGVLGFKVPYINLLSSKRYSDLVKSFLFPQFLRYFICLIETQGNVYKTLEATLPYIENEMMKREVKKLIDEISVSNDRQAYMNFAEFIGDSEANIVMSMIYEFSEYGIQKKELEELEKMIERLRNNKVNDLIHIKINKMEKYANPAVLIGIIFTLVFAGILFVDSFRTAMAGL